MVRVPVYVAFHPWATAFCSPPREGLWCRPSELSHLLMDVCPPQGFDEYMNLVLDDATEIDAKKESRVELGGSPPPLPIYPFYPFCLVGPCTVFTLGLGAYPVWTVCPLLFSSSMTWPRFTTTGALGRILLKGDTITLMRAAEV